jgi:hypothetical protein
MKDLSFFMTIEIQVKNHLKIAIGLELCLQKNEHQ